MGPQSCPFHMTQLESDTYAVVTFALKLDTACRIHVSLAKVLPPHWARLIYAK